MKLKYLHKIFVFLIVLLTVSLSYAQQQEEKGYFHTKSAVQENTFQVYLPFTGQWLPNVDSELVGLQNYVTLTNMRYKDGGVEGTNGYTKINTSVVNSTYYKVRSGYHFKKDYPPESHILVQSYNYDGTASRIYNNETGIPSQGNFNSTPIHTDTSFGTFTGEYRQDLKFEDVQTETGTHKTKFSNISTTGGTHKTTFEDLSVAQVDTFTTFRARFAKGPVGHIIYSNGVESQIWGGNESRVAAFILSSSNVTEYATNPKDYTDQVNNEYDTSTERVTIDASSTTAYFLIGSTRPISGVSFQMQSDNATAGANIQIAEWNGTTFNDLDETDNTTGLSSDGEVSFSSTVSTAKPKYLEGLLLYWYLGQLSAGSAVVYNITLDIPWQDIVDLWDGVYRIPISFQASRSGEYEDWTLEVAEGSSDLYPIGADVGGLIGTDPSGVSDYIIIGFEDRMQAIYFEMLSGNTNAFGPATEIYTWNGDSWAMSAVTYDHTGDDVVGHSGVSPLGQSGALTWQPPDHEDEFKRYLFGVEGYFYKIHYGGILGGANAADDAVIIDRVYGIPTPLKLQNFKFPAFYKNRVFLLGYLKGNEANRIDYSATNAPDVWNGVETSNDGTQSLYIGGAEEPTAAVPIYNRYGSQIYESLIIFKESETYLLSGDGPDDFKVRTISSNLGCPAPYTVSGAEVGYEMVPGELQRNIIIWLSSTGPYLFDGAVLVPILGLDKYFDKSDPDYIGASNIENAFAWYDPTYREWNLVVGEYWFAYDFIRKSWFLRDTGDAEDIQYAFQVVDSYGNKYVYGAIDTGYVMRLENGNSWDGTGIEQTVETGDFYLDGNPWQQSELRRLKLSSKVLTEVSTVQVTHYANMATSGTSVFSVALNSGSNASRRSTDALDMLPAWMHRIKFNVTTDDTNKGWQPIGWGYQYQPVREDW